MSVTTETPDETAVIQAPERPRWWVTGPQVRADHPEWDHLWDGARTGGEPELFAPGTLDNWSRDAAAAIVHGTDPGQIFQWEETAHADTAIQEARALAPAADDDADAVRAAKVASALKVAAAVLDGHDHDDPPFDIRPDGDGQDDAPDDQGPAAA